MYMYIYQKIILSFSCPFTSEFQNETLIEASGGLVIQAQELSVSFRVEWHSFSNSTHQQFKMVKHNKAVETAISSQ